eukprot:TRINITY_DN16066_c0_g1_i2.p1 TRINITY_DN16066_c0_g1~~TRINITY_DN16066_c0_g1_i2.p1  ORF type:complete len:124 (+),score=38.77 TRINITY_DN16066_c0_g1_i2:60-431(+)
MLFEQLGFFFFFFSSRRRHTRCREVSWARRCVQETGINAEYMGTVAIWTGMTVHEIRHMYLYRYLFDLKEVGEHGLRYVHRKRSWGDIASNVRSFFQQFIGSFLCWSPSPPPIPENMLSLIHI